MLRAYVMGCHRLSVWLFTVSVVSLTVSGVFFSMKVVSYQGAMAYRRAVDHEERQLAALERFVEELRGVRDRLEKLTPMREASVDETILLDPFDLFMAKLSNLSRRQGFFFVDSLELTTCLGKAKGGRENEALCIPSARLKGRIVSFDRETP